MTLDKKAAECGDTQAAVKTSRAGDHSTRKTPTSTFIQVDVHLGIGADTHSWYILQGWRYKGTHRWEPISWYGSSAPCANGLADKAVRTCGAQSLSQALIQAKRVTSALSQALRLCLDVGASRMREAIRHIPASSNDGARYTPTLVHVDVTRNHHVLADAAYEHAVWYEAVLVYGLPASSDPIAYRWPVAGHDVAIVGMLSVTCLRQLMAALLREGAASIAGLDTDVQLHTAVADKVEAAA